MRNRSSRGSRLLIAAGVLGLALHAPQAAHAGPSSAASMLTTASNASLPAAQHNLGLPTIVQVVGDGVTDDWARIQAAIDNATAPATIAIPSKPNGVRISQALRMRDNITLWSLNWNQPWKCTGDAAGAMAQWPFYGCVLFGSGTATNPRC
jgi:polygalacturonase